MNKTTISFLSTRGRAMNIDLKLIQDYLASNLSDITLEYYLKNTATKIPATNKQLETARLSFCNNTSNIICMDPSIPVKLSPALPEERRLLTLVPYDYLFNEYLKFTENPELAHKKTFFRCTHVLPGSPFFSNFLKNFYEFENATFLDDMCLPLAWDITAKESKENVRNSLEYLYPEAKGKKILTILTVNQTTPEEMTELFSDLNLKKFLDEIGDMPLPVQTKLLRVLQESVVERIGGTKPIPIDIRVICATNKNIEQMVEEGAFREDLYYRLNIIPIELPPLRKRKEDLPALIEYYIAYYNQKLGKSMRGVSPEALQTLTSYDWPGNVREMKNIIEYLENIAEGEIIQLSDLPDHIVMRSGKGFEDWSLDEIVEDYEKRVLSSMVKKGATLEEKNQLAENLKISRATLYRKLKKYDLL